jgi:hypothetical protein
MDLWHVSRAHRTYDALCSLADQDFVSCIAAIDEYQSRDSIVAAQKVIDALDAVMDSWVDTAAKRPDHIHDPKWCYIGPDLSLSELRTRVRRVLDTTVLGITVRDLLTCRAPRETIRSIVQNPPPEAKKIVDTIAKSHSYLQKIYKSKHT